MKRRNFIALIVLAAGQLGMAQKTELSSPLGFTSSIPWLTQSFTWAKGEALSYSRAGSKNMGPWYESALPGRNAFCMRDVSHQTEGAAALGLYAANRNMLGLFVQSAAKSRDWAAYWEIDGDGNPSSADYVSDDDFWFNLPANFDVLDASVRMRRWTGDNSYRDNPAFQRFSNATVTDYMKLWQLQPDSILKRQRIMNRRLTQGKFVDSRGIPSYSEGTKDFILGADLLAAEYRGLRSFAEVATDKKLAQEKQHEADAIQSVLEKVAWSEKEHHYLGAIRKDLSGYGSNDTMILYFDAARNPEHIRGALDYISSPTYWKQIGIEEESYVSLTLFRYGRNDAAYKVLADISAPQKPRREYPEASYSVIEAIVSGVMGLTPGHAGESYDIATLSRLPSASDHAVLTNVSIRQNKINIRHTGTSATSVKNNSGPALHWRAEFPGTLAHLSVAGKQVPAVHGVTDEDTAVSWIDVTVAPGTEVAVTR